MPRKDDESFKLALLKREGTTTPLIGGYSALSYECTVPITVWNFLIECRMYMYLPLAAALESQTIT